MPAFFPSFFFNCHTRFSRWSHAFSKILAIILEIPADILENVRGNFEDTCVHFENALGHLFEVGIRA